ncbi:SIR2 family NAD-dependent protein deacylase [Sporosarcina koreensis]|uniref:SIR2 family NAD-dependent protein deacylase n=1 Tax=Sporosarcina koreensis TaxID=334735 RepID=UPI00075471A2|nr:SIR2 family protein [Sporosarcina koreensis]
MSQYIINELKTKYHDKKIIPFIGAGLSIPFQLKSWSNLIQELKASFLNEAYWPMIDHDLELGEYQSAIENIKKYGGIDDQPIQEKIADCYSRRMVNTDEIVDNNYIDLIKENFRLYLTTNYDRLIEDHVSKINSFSSLTDYTSNIQRLFENQGEKYLFHIHGSVSNPDSIIISSEKYDELYSNEVFDNMMKAFSSSYSFLFLGFSFNDTFVKSLVKNHKKYFKGTHYLLVNAKELDAKQRGELSREYGLRIIEYDATKSSHTKEIRRVLAEITEEITDSDEKTTEQSKDLTYTAIGIDDLINSETHEQNLFYRKLEIANMGEKLCEISKYFYIAAEKFIRTSKKFGLPKEFIDGILAEVFMKYKEKYVEIYDIEGRTSKELLIKIHKNLENINIDRLVNNSNKPTTAESKGFIHVLADDEEKDVWWGSERL